MRTKRSLTPYEWREKHPRCSFCKYNVFTSPSDKYGISCPDYYRCKVKDRIIMRPDLPRPWCGCYKVKRVKEFDEEFICDNEKD